MLLGEYVFGDPDLEFINCTEAETKLNLMYE